MGFLNFLTSISCFFLLLLSLHLFFAKQGNRMLNCLFSLIFFSRFGQMLVLLLINSKEHTAFPFFQQFFTPFYYAAPACFYLYITGLIHGRKQLGKLDWLHFIPVVLAIIHVLPWPFLPPLNWNAIAMELGENKQLFVTEKSGLFPGYFYYLGRPALLLGYLIATWTAVLTSNIIPAKSTNDQRRKWVFFFLKAATFFQLLGFLPLISSSLNRPMIGAAFVILGCLVLLTIMIFVLHNPRVFYSYLFVAVDWNATSAPPKKTPAPESQDATAVSAVKKISLLPDQLAAYSDSMRLFMDRKKPYLQQDFQIVDLAAELNIAVHHCSFVINHLIGKNFRDWINAYRIKFFIEQYPIKSERMTVEAIAFESGFKSLGTFYNAFKKETGRMPKAYFSHKKAS